MIRPGHPAGEQQHDRQRAEAAEERFAALGAEVETQPAPGCPQAAGHVAAEPKAPPGGRRAAGHDHGQEDVEQDHGEDGQADDTFDDTHRGECRPRGTPRPLFTTRADQRLARLVAMTAGRLASSSSIVRGQSCLSRRDSARSASSLPPGLTRRAVVGLVLGVDDALHRRAAHRARLAVAAVDRHVLAERGDLLGKAAVGLLAQPLDPLAAAPPGSPRTASRLRPATSPASASPATACARCRISSL